MSEKTKKNLTWVAVLLLIALTLFFFTVSNPISAQEKISDVQKSKSDSEKCNKKDDGSEECIEDETPPDVCEE